MKALAALATLCVALVISALPAAARDTYVQDGASLLSAATVSDLNAKIGDLVQQTGKEVVVITVPSLGGDTVQAAAEHAFSTQRVNGTLIYIAKAEKKDLVLTGRASKAFFPSGTTATIHDAMRGYFRSGDFDGGVKTGAGIVINTYRGHLNALSRQHATNTNVAQPAYAQQFGGFHMSWFWWLIVIIAIFLIVRAIMRAMMGPRMMPPGAGGPGYGQPGYGQPMGGMGGGMGGGGFWSGMLGGLGGAFLGNELFGRHDGGNFGGDQAGMGGGSNNPDSSGFQNDAGQADMGNSGGGDYGDSGGGGFDAGGGGGGGGGDW